MNFGDAIKLLKSGKCVYRAGWNGKGMWLILVNEDKWSTGLLHPMFFAFEHPELGQISPAPWIGMKTTDNKFVPWLASQTDILTEDWLEGLGI